LIQDLLPGCTFTSHFMPDIGHFCLKTYCTKPEVHPIRQLIESTGVKSKYRELPSLGTWMVSAVLVHGKQPD
jgi:hypothetical protein